MSRFLPIGLSRLSNGGSHRNSAFGSWSQWLTAGLALMLGSAGAHAQNSFGTVAVGSAVTQNVTVTAANSGNVATVQVVTTGSNGLDFTAGSAGTCAAANLLAGQTCRQSVTFTVAFPGQRLGAVVLLDSSNQVLGTAYLNGVGKAGLAVFSPGNIVPAAGSGAWDLVDDNQLATNADLNLPSSVVLDAAGNMYIADSVHNRIRKVDATTKIITTIAGNGNSGFAGDGGLAASSATSLNTPSGVAIDGAGNVYIADTGNNRIRKISASTLVISTIAGTGASGSSGDNGPAIAAELNQPWGITVDVAGNLYIADTGNHRIRKIDQTGTITTVAGNGFSNGDGSGAFAGDGGPATAAELNRPYAVAFDLAGNMYIPDSGNNRIREVDTAGNISTIAGNGTVGFSGDGGPATAAQLWAPSGVLVDVAQNIYISDTQNNAVRKISASTGDINTVVRSAVGKYLYQSKLSVDALYGPIGLALDGYGNLYVADYYYMRIREIQANVAALDFTATATRQGDTSAPISQTVENDGNDALSLTSVTPDANSAVGTGTTCGNASLAVEGTCTIAAEFAPTVASNPLIAAINIQGQTVDSPMTLNLVGDATPVNSTTVVLTATPNPSNFGQTVTFSAAVTTGAGTGSLTGTVSFLDGTTTLQTGVALNAAGVATFSTPALAVGSHTITASYNGDKLHFASTSDPVTQVVDERTSVSLVSSANPAAVGTPVTFTATTSVVGGGSVTPDGTITFMDGPANLGSAPIAGGVASLTVSSLADGVHSITAVYSGDTTNDILSATSAVLQEDVLAASNVSVNSTPNPSIYGSSVTFTATISSNGSVAPSGTVNFLDGATKLGSATVNGTSGVATFTTSALNAGSHPITAAYLGNSNDGPGTSAPIIQVVNLTATSTALIATPAPGIAGKPVVLTATVFNVTGSGAVTGTVTFTDGSSTIATGKIGANGIATASVALAPGAHALVATYSGDTNNMASASSPLPLAVNLATTAVALQSSASPAVVLQPVVFTATVTGNGGTPSGSVTFVVDGANANTAPLNASGVATFSDAALTVGTHSITASYAGDTNDNPSSSPALSQQETPIATTTGLGSSATAGPNSQLILVATTVGATGPTPTGTVTFNSGSQVIGTATLDATGVGTLVPDLSPGNYSIVARYSGDSLHASSSSPAVSVSGTPIGFGVAVDPTTISMATSQNATVNVTISSQNGFADTIGMGCLSVPAAINCHFSNNSVALKAGQSQTVQLTIDTNSPLSGGTTASNAAPGNRTTALAGLFFPVSVLFGCIFWRFRKRNPAALLGALVLFLAGAFAVTGCGGFTQSSASPGTYTLQVGGVGTNSNTSHYATVTLTVTK